LGIFTPSFHVNGGEQSGRADGAGRDEAIGAG
jgi:hypothetical protein